MSDVKETIRQYILTTYLPGESAANLKDDTPLRSSGILDSLATLSLVSFVEKQFRIELDAHETGIETFDTIEAIATLVERQSRYVMLVRLPNKETHTVIRALARRIRRLPHGLMKSLTWDRGTELASHRAFTMATKVQVYFCDPRSPWQRGSNENTNGLLRQYLPHAADLTGFNQARLDAIALRLNTRPRMTLGYQTPAAKLAEIVASMG